MYIQDRVFKIADDIKLGYEITSITENKRLKRSIARVLVNRNTKKAEIELSSMFFSKLTSEGQDRVLKHELMHVKHSEITGKHSNHLKEFKDLCESFFGDRTIGNSELSREYIK